MRRIVLGLVMALALAGCSLSRSEPRGVPDATPLPAVTLPGADQPLVVAWAVNGDLVVWRSGEDLPRRIASGGVIRPILAPDGTAVAYLRGPEGDARSLWISDVAGTAERQVVDTAVLVAEDETRRLSQVVWAVDGDALYFNMRMGDGIEAREADDLWRVDVNGGAPERLLPDGDGGQIALSPDGATLALASAGEYGVAPGAVTLYTPATGAHRRALEFSAVATGSERRWYPAPRWLPDGSGLRVAVPPPDLIYGGDGSAVLTTLWRVPVPGEAESTGQVEADFFGLPVFSADGTHVAYFRRRTAPDQATLELVLAADGSSPAVYAEGGLDTLALPAWLPEGDRFMYASGAPGEWWLGQPGADPARFPAPDVLALDVVWADANTYVFSAQSGDTFTLSFGLLDVPVRPQHITSLDVYPIFDAVLP